MKIKPLLGALSVFAAILGYSTIADAALIDRGGGLIYDDALDITWLYDANYALTSGSDPDATLDGRMTLSDANTWVTNLSYYDSVRDVTYDDWRLASMNVNQDETIVDCATVSEPACQDNEYGHLYHVDGITAGNPGLLFENIQGNVTAGGYWSGTPSGPTISYAFQFSDSGSSSDGSNLQRNNSSILYPWAVRDGDVSAIPTPAAAWLFGSALLGLGMVKRKKA